MTALLTALMAWVSAATGYPVAEVPNHVFKPKCEIAAIWVPNFPCEQVPVIAFYEAGTMLLPDTWSADDLYSVSVLVHELVHHLQFNAGRDMGECREFRNVIEEEAYDVQRAFLAAVGLSEDEVLAVMNMNDLSLHMATSCDLGE